MMIQNEDQQALAKLLANYTDLLAAWLFGSSQTGMVHPGSDIDIAVWFTHSPDLSELVALRADLQDALQFDEIDLVVLNNASPITRFEAVSG